METNGTLIPAGEALAAMESVLNRIDPDRSKLDAATRLAWVRTARRVRGRMDALASMLTAEADRARAAETAARTPLASWLGSAETVSRKEAAGAVRRARRLGQHPGVGQAAVAGRVGATQAEAITGVLDTLAPQLDRSQQAQAEQLLIALADHLDAGQLSKSAGRVLAEVAPADANELLEQQLQRQTEQAWRQRSLRFFHEGAQVRFDGCLPKVEAEAWIAQLDACAEAQRRTAIEARDPLATSLTPEQRRADALITLTRTRGEPGEPTQGAAPTTRVLVQLDYAKLRAEAAGAGVLADGTALSAGELRRCCCDAEIIPVVLGTPSEVLDVGRAQRLVTTGIRFALIARDGGCVFPGCDAPPALCEAHHIIPWWAGGATALHNLVLLCHRHHPVVEPARYSVRDQWQVRIDDDGLPEFTPPGRLDHNQKPVRHPRHQRPTDRNTGPPGARGAGPPTAA